MRLFLCLKKGFSYRLDPSLLIVIPAQAGIQWLCGRLSREQTSIRSVAKTGNRSHWVPACAGMTS
jgi:hypothetical protein